MRLLGYLSCACFLGVLGCGDGGDGSSGVPANPVYDVTGTIVDTHLTEGGDLTYVEDPGQFEIAAIVPGEGGTRREILAEVFEDGTFILRGLPEGPYDLRFTEAYGSGTLPPRILLNAPKKLDLGRVYTGRPDAAPVLNASTKLDLTFDGLDPWADGSSIELFSLGAGTIGTLAPTSGMAPMNGATSITGYGVAMQDLAIPNIIDEGAGDEAYFTQTVGTSGLDAPYRSVRKAIGPLSLTSAEGASTPVSGSFVALPEKKLSIAFDDAAFSALASSVNPGASIAGKEIRVGVEPGGDRTAVSPTPDLLRLSALPAQNAPSELLYGNPFPGSFRELAAIEVLYEYEHVAPTGVPKKTAIAIGRTGPSESFSGTVGPVIGPPLDVTVNDQPAYGEVLGIGKTPTLRWSPPSLGTPATYVVTLRRLDPGGATTRTVAYFITTETSLTIPDGMLDVGYYYYVRVGVRDAFDHEAPFRVANTRGYAEALTGVLSP